METVVVQQAIRARLIANPSVTDLVPAANILDRHARPAPTPSIILGEAQSVPEAKMTRVFHMVHVWQKEASLAGANLIAAKIKAALTSGRLDLGPDFHCADSIVSDIRLMRDPDGETSHAVLTVESLVQEVAI